MNLWSNIQSMPLVIDPCIAFSDDGGGSNPSYCVSSLSLLLFNESIISVIESISNISEMSSLGHMSSLPIDCEYTRN